MARRLRLPAAAVLLLCSGLPSAAQPVFNDGPDATVVIELPDNFAINDARPMGLNDIAAVFPFAGPFASQADGAPGDRYLHETLDDVDRSFLNQLLPVMQARWPSDEHPCDKDTRKLCPHADDPLHCLGLKAKQLSKGCVDEIRHTVPYVCSDEIHLLCDDGLEKGVLPCLERNGAKLDPTCLDSVIAVRHALSSLKSARQEAADKLSPKAQKKQQKPKHSRGPTCPKGWESSNGGCCTRRWSPTCGASCSAAACNESPGGWEFKWVDFRTHPYICCPKAKTAAHIGGQPICPAGWQLDKGGKMNFCCRRGWNWSCGQHCAEEQCVTSGLKWVPVDFKREHYACCPEGYEPPAPAPSRWSSAGAAAKSASGSELNEKMPDALGESWVSKPMDLAAGGWTSVALLVGIVVVVVLVVRWLLPKAQGQPGRRGPKDH